MNDSDAPARELVDQNSKLVLTFDASGNVWDTSNELVGKSNIFGDGHWEYKDNDGSTLVGGQDLTELEVEVSRKYLLNYHE